MSGLEAVVRRGYCDGPAVVRRGYCDGPARFCGGPAAVEEELLPSLLPFLLFFSLLLGSSLVKNEGSIYRFSGGAWEDGLSGDSYGVRFRGTGIDELGAGTNGSCFDRGLETGFEARDLVQEIKGRPTLKALGGRSF
ncbi:hypothetical protein MA16_Dca021555 [Dendrobium catenatum]|uniref:Uncharacterized protein n=1 Tax=Dendrobium catenatum TaxID=906689 RepID=A0A2I0VTZ6_9ASPA|nr:hypothetical protein MA16_Dca021555 [Dendrobium catenatum]